MNTLVERIDHARSAVEARMKALPPSDELGKKLAPLANRLELTKRKIVATKEGGAITGEERIREHLDQLYGALNGWEGRPARYQLDRIGVLKRELDDVGKEFETFLAQEIKPLDEELRTRHLDPIRSARASADLPEAHGGTLSAALLRCVRSAGAECDLGARAAESDRERD